MQRARDPGKTKDACKKANEKELKESSRWKNKYRQNKHPQRGERGKPKRQDQPEKIRTKTMRKAKNRKKKKKEWTKIKYRHNPPKKSIGKVRDRISTGGMELKVLLHCLT